MAKSVFRPGEMKTNEDKVMLPLVHNYQPVEEVVEEVVEEYTGPTADDLRREAEAFKKQWEAEKQQLESEANVRADQIIKNAEAAAFAEVKRQTDAAAEIKASAEQEAEAIIAKAKAEADQIVAEAQIRQNQMEEDAKKQLLKSRSYSEYEFYMKQIDYYKEKLNKIKGGE